MGIAHPLVPSQGLLQPNPSPDVHWKEAKELRHRGNHHFLLQASPSEGLQSKPQSNALAPLWKKQQTPQARRLEADAPFRWTMKCIRDMAGENHFSRETQNAKTCELVSVMV